SNPSMAVKTSHPSFARSVSAVRRMVLLSSITRTFRPCSFALLPLTSGDSSRSNDHPHRRSTHRRCPPAYGGWTEGKRSAVLTYRYNLGYATHVTFSRIERAVESCVSRGADIFAVHPH